MRRPEPWHWEARKGWYVQLNRKQVELGSDETSAKDKAKNPTPPPAVMREYHRLMAGHGLFAPEDRRKLGIAEIAEAFLESKSGLSDSATKLYTRWLRLLAVTFRGRKLTSIAPNEIERLAAEIRRKAEEAEPRRDPAGTAVV